MAKLETVIHRPISDGKHLNLCSERILVTYGERSRLEAFNYVGGSYKD